MKTCLLGPDSPASHDYVARCVQATFTLGPTLNAKRLTRVHWYHEFSRLLSVNVTLFGRLQVNGPVQRVVGDWPWTLKTYRTHKIPADGDAALAMVDSYP